MKISARVTFSFKILATFRLQLKMVGTSSFKRVRHIFITRNLSGIWAVHNNDDNNNNNSNEMKKNQFHLLPPFKALKLNVKLKIKIK